MILIAGVSGKSFMAKAQKLGVTAKYLYEGHGDQYFEVSGPSSAINQLIKETHSVVSEEPMYGEQHMPKTFKQHCASKFGEFDDNVQILVKNIKEYATKAKRQGTLGMSKDNLKQVVSTRGLTIPPAVFQQAFDQAVAQVKIPDFEIYESSQGPSFKHHESFSVGGSRFTGVSPEAVREKLATMSDAAISKYLGQIGEPESPSESRLPKHERLVQAWVDGRLPDLAIDLGLAPKPEDLRKRYGA